jgi:ketosteroid isomerase-like protein
VVAAVDAASSEAMMRRFAFLLRAALVALPFCVAQAADTPLAQLVNAELSFSKMAGERGIRESFLYYLTDDSIILAPRPVNGKQVTREGSADTGVLSWYASFAGISGAGDLGYSSGPYEYRSAAGAAPIGFGYFISIWRKEPNGEWKVVFDTGVRNVREVRAPEAFERKEENRKPAAPLTATALAQRERALHQAETNLQSQVIAHGATARLVTLAGDVRFFRDRRQPLIERKSIAAFLREEKSAPAWKVEKIALAASGDLGYAYGMATVPGGIPEERSWMRVWSLEDGVWKIRLDMELPVPAAMKTESK